MIGPREGDIEQDCVEQSRKVVEGGGGIKENNEEEE